jgi:phospholipid/cholesterol/gamma-HCH transport system ATP-binding protein
MATAPVVQQTTREHTEDPVVVFDHVSIGFEGKEVLKDISFAVHPGETRLLLGPAGGGKSVLLKLVDGLMRPDEGRIFVFGKEVSSMRERDLLEMRATVGMVFQEGALFDSLTVGDNVAYRLIESHVAPEEIQQRVLEALRFVELEHTVDKFPSQLSGGMRRRVAIARAIVGKPDLLLYDSPTGGLDPITSTNIIELVMKQRDVYHTSSLLITHRLQDAFTLATHQFNQETNHMEPIAQTKSGGNHGDLHTSFLILNNGKLVFDGSTHELVGSDDPFIRDYLR